MPNKNYYKPLFHGAPAGRDLRAVMAGVSTIEEQQNENLPFLLEPQKFQRVSSEILNILVEPVSEQWERVRNNSLIQEQQTLSELHLDYEAQHFPWSRRTVENKDEEKYLQETAENQDYADKQETLKQINPDTVELIVAEAQAHGISIDEYVRSLLPGINDAETGLYRTTTAEEWVNKFRDWAGRHPVLAVIADDSRESIYEGRGE